MKVHHCQVCFGLELRRLKATNPGILEPAWMEGHRTLAGIVSGWWGTVCVFLFSMVVMCMGEGRLCFSFSSFFHQCDCVEGQMSVSSLYSFTHSSHGRDFSGRGGWERKAWKPRSLPWKGCEAHLAVLPQAMVGETCLLPPWSSLSDSVLHPWPPARWVPRLGWQWGRGRWKLEISGSLNSSRV